MTHISDHTDANPAGGSRESSGKAGYLKHQFLGCFLAIAIVTAVASTVALMEIGVGTRLLGVSDPEQVAALFGALRWRIALGAAMIIAVAGGVFFLLNRRIALPLEKTAAAAGRMADGYLETTMPVSAPNEIGRIGESVNGLAVNFQEVLILVWNQTENALARIQRTTRKMTPDASDGNIDEMKAELSSARQDLENMRLMVRSFDLYDVTITETDALATKGKVETLN